MNERQIFHINKRSFLTIILILGVLMLCSIGLILIIPQGIIQEGVYIPLDQPIVIWKLIASPFMVLISEGNITVIMISLFILILAGAFNIMDKTGGIESILQYFIRRFAKKKMLLMHLIVLLFMSFGAFFGVFEEAVTLLPMVILLALSLGWDTFTGVGMCLLAAGFGFSSAITNPFSVGLGSLAMGLSIMEGIGLRIATFIIMYIVLCLFLRLHIRKIEKDPTRSPTYEIDLEKRENLSLDVQTNPRTFRIYSVFFIVLLVIIVVTSLIPSIQMYSIPLIALAFLVGGFVCGIMINHSFSQTCHIFFKGLKAMAPAIVLILMASSIRYILEEGVVLGTIIHEMSTFLGELTPFQAVLSIYFMILFIQFFIGSASAKIPLIIPIIAELSTQVGITKNIALLAFVFGDGFTDLIYPTNPVLLIGIGLAGIGYGQWVKKTWLLQLLVFIITCIILYIAFVTHY
ncbi:MAG: Na+/H+ antiporter NhaC family protein [Bacilli bacterium]